MKTRIHLNTYSHTIILYILLIVPVLNFGQRLEEGFDNPPISSRSKAFWSLVNGNYSLSAMTEELEEFKKKGMGGIDIWDVSGWVDPNGVIPAGPNFMGDESLQAIAHAVREAKRLNLETGLVVSSSWNSGGEWVSAKDGVMGLFRSKTILQGPSLFEGSLEFPDVPKRYKNNKEMLLEIGTDGLPSVYKEVAVLAYRIPEKGGVLRNNEVIDVSANFHLGKLIWEVPSGKWKIVRYVCTGTGQPLMQPSPNSNGRMIDHFSANAQRNHLNFFFEKLTSELGNLEESGLDYLYNDSYEANSSNWTIALPEVFEDMNGYSLVPFLPILDGEIVDDEETSERFLFDFNKTLSDLIISNQYVLGKELCAENGIGFIAEAGGPGPPLHNVPFESLSALGSLTAPRGEFWFDTLKDDDFINSLQIIKGPARAAHLYNLPWVEAEAFTGTLLWQYGPSALKESADRALCDGLTRFVYHTTPHIPPEAGKPGWVYNFGTLINTSRVWWNKSANFHEYIARSCYLLQQGNFVGDVLYYYGDQAPNFVDPLAVEGKLGFGYDYDFTNSDIILNHLEMADGYFTLPHGQKYKVLVLPDSKSIPVNVLEKIAYLVEKGGIVLGNPLTRAHGLVDRNLNDKKIKSLSAKIWSNRKKNSYGQGHVFTTKYTINEVLEKVNIAPDIKTNLADTEKKLDFIHRSTEEEDIYFIRNMTDSRLDFDCTLRSAKGAPEFWNQVTGERSKATIFLQEAESTTLPVSLEPLGSIFIILSSATKPENQIVQVIKNNKTIFPNTTEPLGISPYKTGFTFSKPGIYQLNFKDGKTRVHTIEKVREELELKGPWEIRFPFGWGAPRSTVFDSLISWPEAKNEGIQHFSGIAAYHKTFEIEKKFTNKTNKVTLNLGKVAEIADVYLNGKHIGVVWHDPFTIDVTDAINEGTNYLTIEVGNTWRNQLIKDATRKDQNKKTHTNITKGPNAWITPLAELELLPAGLLGPVTLDFETRAKKLD